MREQIKKFGQFLNESILEKTIEWNVIDKRIKNRFLGDKYIIVLKNGENVVERSVNSKQYYSIEINSTLTVQMYSNNNGKTFHFSYEQALLDS